jgi:hypothetical protein
MKHKQCEKHCVKNVVQGRWESIQLPQGYDGLVAGMVRTRMVSLNLITY